MMVGAAAALVVILGMNAFYDLAAFMMGGTGSLPSGWSYGPSGISSFLPIAEIASRMLSDLELVFSLGAGPGF